MAGRRTKRSDGRFCLNITVENPDGTKRRVYFYGRTQAEAKAKAAAARERVGRGEPVRDATRTVSDWLAEWRTTFLRASDRAESTKDLYAGLTVRHVEPLIGHSGARPGQALGHHPRAPAHGAAGPGGQHPPQRLRGHALGLRRRGDRRPSRRQSRCCGSSARGRRTTRRRASTPEQVARLLHGARDLRYAKVLRLILGTGLRRGEALALRWQDVRLDRCELSIKGSLTRRGSELVVSDAKTQRSRRVVSLSPAMVRLITEHRAEQVAERLRAGNLWEDTGFVFATEFGCPVDPRNLLRTTTLAAKRARLPQIGVHTLRHTYATTALLNNVPMHVVSRNLGHSSIMITADIYGHLTDDAARSAALVVSDALNL